MIGAALWLFHALKNRKELEPFVATLTLFVSCFVGLGISLYPNLVPPKITIWNAASPDGSLRFLLVGASVLIPIIVAYTVYSYWVFRGKIGHDEGYH